MHYSVCVPAVLDEKIDRALSNVKKAGFDHYEFWSWWDQDVDAIQKAQEEYGLKVAGFCTRLISLTDPACRESYKEGLRETIEICHKLGCKTIISQVGNELKDVPREEQHASIVAGLRECVPMLAENDLTLVIEPLNTKIDHAGYYLWEAAEAYQIIDEVGDEHVKVLFDLYHQYAMNDLVLEDVLKNMDKIGHFHMAGYPGRHEPMIDSEIDYPVILKAIRESGYKGSVGLEYLPVNDGAAGLEVLYPQLP